MVYSTLYKHSVKLRETPKGRKIVSIRAVTPRSKKTSPPPTQNVAAMSTLSGWPTPMAGNQGKPGRYNPAGNTDFSRKVEAMCGKDVAGHGLNLSGWTTASARDWKDTGGMATTAVNPDGSSRSRLDQLPRQAAMTGWGTPVANPANGTPEAFIARKEKAVARGVQMGTTVTDIQMQAMMTGPVRLTVSGEMLTGSDAGMVSGGQLNPDLPRWLMGYPEALQACLPGYEDWRNWQGLMHLVSNEPSLSEN